MNESEKIGRLLAGYIRREMSPTERKDLAEWRHASADNERFFQQETNPESIRAVMRAHDESSARIFKKIEERYPAVWNDAGPRKPGILIRMFRVAAAVTLTLLAMAITGVFLESRYTKYSMATILTIDGQAKIWTDIQMGYKAGKLGISVKTKKNGDLYYRLKNDDRSKPGEVDKLFSSADTRIEMQMPDSSHIWMNLGSEVIFPLNYAFSDTVAYHISGEAYLVLPAGSKKYYGILADSLVIKTAGAELDVLADKEKGIYRVLLFSGTAWVKPLSNTGDSTRFILLHPGEQALVSQGKLMVSERADMHSLIPWKE